VASHHGSSSAGTCAAQAGSGSNSRSSPKSEPRDDEAAGGGDVGDVRGVDRLGADDRDPRWLSSLGSWSAAHRRRGPRADSHEGGSLDARPDSHVSVASFSGSDFRERFGFRSAAGVGGSAAGLRRDRLVS
jgi:hypothetical protein